MLLYDERPLALLFQRSKYLQNLKVNKIHSKRYFANSQKTWKDGIYPNSDR